MCKKLVKIKDALKTYQHATKFSHPMQLTLDLLPNVKADKVEPFHLRHGMQEVNSCEGGSSTQISCINPNIHTLLQPKVMGYNNNANNNHMIYCKNLYLNKPLLTCGHVSRYHFWRFLKISHRLHISSIIITLSVKQMTSTRSNSHHLLLYMLYNLMSKFNSIIYA